VAKTVQVRYEQLSLEVTLRQELHEQMHRISCKLIWSLGKVLWKSVY